MNEVMKQNKDEKINTELKKAKVNKRQWMKV